MRQISTDFKSLRDQNYLIQNHLIKHSGQSTRVELQVLEPFNQKLLKLRLQNFYKPSFELLRAKIAEIHQIADRRMAFQLYIVDYECHMYRCT